MNISVRLREERERLGLNQVEFGSIGGVKKLAQINYEKGERHPDSAYLAAIAAAGADVLYILTGQRSQPVPPAQELPRQEQEWLALYRNSSEEVRAALKAAGNELTKPSRARGKAA